MYARVYSIFWSAPGARPVLITLLMLIASIADLLSMGALVPLVAQITNDNGGAKSWIAQRILDFVAALGISPSLGHLLILVGIGLTLKSLITWASLSFVGLSVADVTTRLRSRMLNALVRANWGYFSDHKPGEVASQIAAQSNAAGQAYLSAGAHVTTFIACIGMLIASLLISPVMTLLTGLAVILLAGPLNAILKIADRASKRQWQDSNELTTSLEDVVNNMKPLKAMGREAPFVKSFNDHITGLRSTLIQVVVSGYSTLYIQDIIASILVLFGVWLAVSWLQIPLSQFFVFGVVFYQLIDVIKRTQQSMQIAITNSASYTGVMDTIARGEKAAERNLGTQDAQLNQALRFEDVSFSYGGKTVLSHANAEVPAREITVLVGPSGAGKTTFVDLIIGFNLPQKGKLTADGIDLAALSLESWRQQIGYVPQELTLLRGSVADNIGLGDARISTADIDGALQLAGASEFVKALPQGIHTEIGTMGAKLSGGQRQRISLARALVHKPKLLLLDEVTSAVDEETEADICRNIQALAGQMTIVAITHRPAWKSIASRIYRISHGKAVLENSKVKKADSRSRRFSI